MALTLVCWILEKPSYPVPAGNGGLRRMWMNECFSLTAEKHSDRIAPFHKLPNWQVGNSYFLWIQRQPFDGTPIQAIVAPHVAFRENGHRNLESPHDHALAGELRGMTKPRFLAYKNMVLAEQPARKNRNGCKWRSTAQARDTSAASNSASRSMRPWRSTPWRRGGTIPTSNGMRSIVGGTFN